MTASPTVAAEVAPLRAITDPLARFDEAGRQAARLRAVAAELDAVRALAALEMNEARMSLDQIAEHAGFSRSRAQQLVADGRRIRRAEEDR